MTDKEKLKRLEKALKATAQFSQEAAKGAQQQETRNNNVQRDLKALSKGLAAVAMVSGIGTGGVIGIVVAPYVLPLVKSLIQHIF